MNYMESYQFIFKSPKWFMNVLLGLVCSFIPVVGPVVWLGYCFEIVAYLHHRKSDQGAYPDFDFNNFVPYLIRGFWIFIARLVFILPILFVAMIVGFGLGLSAAAIQNEVVGIVVVLVVVLLFFTFQLAVLILHPPVTLRGGFTQDFGAIFDMAFIKDFVGKMWVESLLAGLFLFFSSFALAIVGLLALCVGIYFVVPIVGMAQEHICYQLYELYLERGGQAIPEFIRPPSPTPPSTNIRRPDYGG